MAETRKLKRRHLIYYLRVMDSRTGRLLGHLVDVTTEGIMLMSQQPIPTGELFKLRMVLPAEAPEQTVTIDLEAKSLWSRKDVNPDFFDTGFQIVTASPPQLAAIATLIDDHGFRD
jgi:hypothetical protein